MAPEGITEVFLSCFKCGRIVKSSDAECPRCGMKFGPGTLFECPFCSGLVWRNASVCSSCGTDFTEFSAEVERACSRFDMDEFVDTIISIEMKELKSAVRRVACPGCGLMIRGDEETCPRCDLPLSDARVDCPVCGEKISISSQSCEHCQAVFEEAPEAPARPKPVAAVAEAPAAEPSPAVEPEPVMRPEKAVPTTKPRGPAAAPAKKRPRKKTKKAAKSKGRH